MVSSTTEATKKQVFSETHYHTYRKKNQTKVYKELYFIQTYRPTLAQESEATIIAFLKYESKGCKFAIPLAYVLKIFFFSEIHQTRK